MRFVRFLAAFTADDSPLRAAYLAATTDAERVALLRQQKLSLRQVGIVLREDRTAAVAEIAQELASWDFANNRPGVIDDNPYDAAPAPDPPAGTGDDDDEVAWPGPAMAVALEAVEPALVPPHGEVQVLLKGWHLSNAVQVAFERADAPKVLAAIDWTHHDPISGETWIGARVTLPRTGAWSVRVTNLVGNYKGIESLLPDAVTAVETA